MALLLVDERYEMFGLPYIPRGGVRTFHQVSGLPPLHPCYHRHLPRGEASTAGLSNLPVSFVHGLLEWDGGFMRLLSSSPDSFDSLCGRSHDRGLQTFQTLEVECHIFFQMPGGGGVASFPPKSRTERPLETVRLW